MPHRLLFDDNAGTGLQVCRTCGGLSGRFVFHGTSLDQTCICFGRSEPLWPRYDFNEALTLCHGCGGRVLKSGSRWSVWFCEPCKTSVCRVNDLCCAYVIPIGRHSIMGSKWQRGLAVQGLPADIQAFATTLAGLFDRIDLVNKHHRQCVELNCREAGLGSRPALRSYLSSSCVGTLTTGRRLRRLFECFDVPKSVLTVIATDHSN